ncbi:DUF6292 family protein [Actinokineospora sp. HUAS TT18]|uniref:DUF6292 family protein n=1 Tax=Actinokineospora sp. HUAS TT18 TaxID=3447451 RepID=UPI003F51B3E6
MESTGQRLYRLDRPVARLPSRDFALVWDEVHGWAATVETDSGEDLIVLAYLLGDVLPKPAEVVEFARDMLAGRYPRHPVGTTHPPGRRAPLGHDTPGSVNDWRATLPNPRWPTRPRRHRARASCQQPRSGPPHQHFGDRAHNLVRSQVESARGPDRSFVRRECSLRPRRSGRSRASVPTVRCFSLHRAHPTSPLVGRGVSVRVTVLVSHTLGGIQADHGQ